MKKKVLSILFALVAIATTAQAQVVLNEQNFPDENFRAALASKLGISEGDEITAEKIAATLSLSISRRFIADLTGIEHFTALKKLSCYSNQLTSLDVSKNSELIELHCYSNQLTSLDVSGCTALTSLDCSDNQLTSLDVSKNSELIELRCNSNQLTSLDVLENTKLTLLNCSGNQLTELDVSNNTVLTGLGCADNQLTLLNVSNNTVLTELYSPNNQLTSLDVLKNTKLTLLNCSGNQLTELNISKNTALTRLDCYENKLTELDVSKNTALTTLYCSGNQLTSLDVSNNTVLKRINCVKNKIKDSAMDVLIASMHRNSNGEFYVIAPYFDSEENVITKTQVVIAKRKGWTTYYWTGEYESGGNWQEYEGSGPEVEGVLLNAENFPDANFRAALAKELGINEGGCITVTEAEIAATKSLNISGKSIADLTGIEHFTALTYLRCDNNQLTELDVSKNTALESLECSGNQLTLLNVSGCTALTLLSCGWNQFTSLDVSKNIALTTLYCHKNQLTSLDVSKNTALTYLACGNNQLASLDVSKNTALTELSCYDNQLTLLDVSQNIALERLYCGDNLLTSLNVFQNTALTTLYCYCNKIKGKAMDELVASLPNVSKGEFSVICTQDENEGNVCTKVQVKVAKEKGWRVSDFSKEPRTWENANDPDPEYEGSDEEIILDEENFGDTNFREALSGILNIAEGDDITEEVINNTTTLDVSDKSIANLSGIEHFTALTTLYCHINQIKNEEMTTLIAALPDLSSNEAKGMMRAEETNPRTGALYALDFTDENEQNVCTAEHVAAANAKGWTVYCKKANGWQEYDGENSTGIGTPLNDNGKNDRYSIDGVKLNGEPEKKGIYIHNGKKVVK